MLVTCNSVLRTNAKFLVINKCKRSLKPNVSDTVQLSSNCHLSTYLLNHLPSTYLPTYLITSLPVFLPYYMPTFLNPFLSTYLCYPFPPQIPVIPLLPT